MFWQEAKNQGQPNSMRWSQSYHPGFRMKLTIPSAGEVTNYKRTTNYQTGEVIINFTDDNGDWERRNFTSRDQDIVVTLLSKLDYSEWDN